MWVAHQLKASGGGSSGPGDTRIKPFVVPQFSRDYPIVGRNELVEEIWSLLLARRSASLHFLPGVGKTTLALRLLNDRKRVLEHFEGVLWANIGRCPDIKAVFREWALALGYTTDQCNGFGTEDSVWQTALRGAIGDKRFLVVLDDVFDAQFATLFAGLVPNGTFVLTTRKRGPAFSNVLPNGEKLVVPALTQGVAQELLAALAPAAVKAFPEPTQQLIAAVDGLPLALLLIGNHLAAASDEGSARLRRAFDRMLQAGERFKAMAPRANGEFHSMAEIIEVSYRAFDDDPEAQAGFRALGIFRPKPHSFDEEIADKVCGVSGDVIDRLSDAGLIEYFGGDGLYTMHRVIAQFARTKLEKERSNALHAAAARYYEGKLKAQAGANRGEYLYWYRYERAEWQSLMDARLYHLSHAGSGEAAMLAFVQRYLDAFWWWGYYQRFEFCEQMLAEWKGRKIGEDFRKCLLEIERFERNYPEGYEKEDEGDWAEVRSALENIRTLLKVADGGANLTSRNGQQVHAFTGFFLAEACAYGAQAREPALANYSAAHAEFVTLGEPWVAAWIRFYEGQYRYEQNDIAGARAACEQGLSEAGPGKPRAELDPELLANLYRLQGDIAFAGDDVKPGLRHYAAASLEAWLFQGIPVDADSYTMAFYVEIIAARIAPRLLDLAGSRRELAVRCCQSLAAFWAPARSSAANGSADFAVLLGQNDASAVASAIFPAPLAESALVAGAPAYAAAVRQLAPTMEQRLATFVAA